jgi:NAD(P)-dependent dehydrogenase (short-subunit alcohol dehydrogenase family)
MAEVAVITGSNGLIGQRPAVVWRSPAISPSASMSVLRALGNWPHYQCDLRDLTRMEATLAEIERDHGLIQVLFNNAGIYHQGKDWLDVPPDQFDDTMSVNVRVPYFASQWVAKRLIAAGQPGAIVNTASVAGQRGSSVVEYGASKAAIINLTRSLGTRLGRHGIRVNAIAPGLINTAMGARVPAAAKDGAKASALGRSGEPEEIAFGGGFPRERCRVVHHLRDDRRERRLIVILAPQTAPTTHWQRRPLCIRESIPHETCSARSSPMRCARVIGSTIRRMVSSISPLADGNEGRPMTTTNARHGTIAAIRGGTLSLSCDVIPFDAWARPSR